ncbi:MAG: DUF3450 domain-containing protein [Candidatus Hydrogenedentes bacterium]|nr:DUF3450 domain-containing protein [Candidatus Hydrogenedentota bacterium]
MDWDKLDKTAFSVCDLADQDDDLAYWLSRSPQERLAAIEFLRQMMYDYDPATERMERVLEIDDLK